MKQTIIKSQGHRYLGQMPEFKEGLPYGILNKVETDVGGSFTAINCTGVNYIVVVPFVDLAYSLEEDINCQYKVQGIYSGVYYTTVQDYLFKYTTHKFVVTYDSLPKLLNWIERNGFNLGNYKILVDEFHTLVESMGYREDAINGLIEELGRVGHYTLMSATPTKDKFLIQSFKELPYTEIDWGSNKKVKPRRIKTGNVYASTIRMIEQFLQGNLKWINNKGEIEQVEELYIFLNSVLGIAQITETLGLTNEEVKIVCADTVRNKYVLDNIGISKMVDPNKKINFFTSKGFQGANLFTNNGLVVLVSDGARAHTLSDIETTITQVAGRLRVNEKYHNTFSNTIWHIYSTKRSTETIEEFEAKLNDNIRESNILVDIYNSISVYDIERREVQRKAIDNLDVMHYFDEKKGTYVYSEMKELHKRQQYEVVHQVYRDGISIRQAYINAGLEPGKQEYDEKFKEVVLKNIVTFRFRDLLEEYIELRDSRNEDAANELAREYPIFEEAYDMIGAEGIRSAGYVEQNIKDAILLVDPQVKQVIYRKFAQKVGYNNFITTTDAKALLVDIYEKMSLNGSPTVTLLDECKWFEVKRVSKRIQGGRQRGIELIKI